MDIPKDDALPQNALGASLLPIIIHQQPKCIQVGKFYGCLPDLYLLPEAATFRKDQILQANDITSPRHTANTTHNVRKLYCAYLGSKFNQRFQKISYALWVGNNEKMIHRFCHRGRKLCNDLVYRFHYFQPLIQKALSNNEQHLIPLLLLLGVDVNTLKAGLGATLWKSLCKNTMSRNHAICACATFIAPLKNHTAIHIQYHEAQAPAIHTYSPALAGPIIEHLNKLPTTLLTCSYFHRTLNYANDYMNLDDDNPMSSTTVHERILQVFQKIAHFAAAKRKISDRDFIRNTHQLINDCHRMASELEVSINADWSLARLAREHKSLVKRYNAIVYAHYHEPYDFLVPWVKTIHFKNILVTLLECRYALVQEGIEMDHCVASYHYEVRNGHSILFSLRNPQNYRTTLQLTIDSPESSHATLQINQHKSFHDDDVVDPDFIEAAKHVLATQQAVISQYHRNNAYHQ